MSNVKPDEQALWAAVVAGERPRQAGRRLGMPRKRVWYLCEKWSRQGRYDYGVTCDLGWPVEAVKPRSVHESVMDILKGRG